MGLANNIGLSQTLSGPSPRPRVLRGKAAPAQKQPLRCRCWCSGAQPEPLRLHVAPWGAVSPGHLLPLRAWCLLSCTVAMPRSLLRRGHLPGVQGLQRRCSELRTSLKILDEPCCFFFFRSATTRHCLLLKVIRPGETLPKPSAPLETCCCSPVRLRSECRSGGCQC